MPCMQGILIVCSRFGPAIRAYPAVVELAELVELVEVVEVAEVAEVAELAAPAMVMPETLTCQCLWRQSCLW